MADKKLSSVSPVSDMNYVYAETASGETVKISKADLASVVAGLIPYPFQYRNSIGYYGKIKDYNNAVDSGIYELKGSGGSNEPPTTKMYGVLIVMKANDNIVQLSFHNDNDEVFFRLFVLGGWRAWTRLSNV